jgi:hypothetical protein
MKYHSIPKMAGNGPYGRPTATRAGWGRRGRLIGNDPFFPFSTIRLLKSSKKSSKLRFLMKRCFPPRFLQGEGYPVVVHIKGLYLLLHKQAAKWA